ncbi:hypothetical protein PybrP1_007210 [[Pythium] brassicae (nom. inval.)]|nr:hypothetical protein PybrP1_007210 [[Pythium] brassicae (nom. inval.)]
MRVFVSGVAALLALSGITEALDVQMHGLNYNSRKGPDWAPFEQRCKDHEAIARDMVTIKSHADVVRIYSLVDCDQGLPVLRAAKRAGLKVALGIWTTPNPSDGHVDSEIARLGKLIDDGLVDDNVVEMHVGSEMIYRENSTVAIFNVAVGYLEKTRNYLRSRGISKLPLTVADVVDSYTQYPQLIDAVDYVSINQFSFWEQAKVEEGTPTMLDRIKSLRVAAAEKGKKVVIGETGWSSKGVTKGASEATPGNQARFFRDFYQVAKTHNFEYYWFMAFDSKWRVDNGDHEVEASFGIYNEDLTMKSNFQSLVIEGAREAKMVRNAGTQLLLTQNSNAVSMTTDASARQWLLAEQQTWFYDAATSTLRSKGNDRCLDSWEGKDGAVVRLYACIDGEKNQKWKFEAATGRLRHSAHSAFCLDTDPAAGNKLQLWGCSDNNKNQQWALETPGQGPSPTSGPPETRSSTLTSAPPDAPAPASDGSVRFFTKESTSTHYAQLVRLDGEVGIGYGANGAANSQWWYHPSSNLVQAKDSNLCLDAYEKWDGGRVHVWECNPKEGNQQWRLDAATGQLKHMTHQGFCLDADQTTGKVALYWCHLSNNNQVWRKVSSAAKGVRLHSELTSDAVLEPKDMNAIFGERSTTRDSQQWFWDPAGKRIVSKWLGGCLDSWEGKDGAVVRLYECIDGEKNQRWTYNAATFAVKHATHAGFCLAYNNMASNRLLQLKACDDKDETQRIRINGA